MLTQMVKQVGMNGQVSLGKEYAGKQIQIARMSDGTLVIKPGRFIPDNEQWLHQDPQALKALDKAVQWSKRHRRRDNFDEIAGAIKS